METYLTEYKGKEWLRVKKKKRQSIQGELTQLKQTERLRIQIITVHQIWLTVFLYSVSADPSSPASSHQATVSLSTAAGRRHGEHPLSSVQSLSIQNLRPCHDHHPRTSYHVCTLFGARFFYWLITVDFLGLIEILSSQSGVPSCQAERGNTRRTSVRPSQTSCRERSHASMSSSSSTWILRSAATMALFTSSASWVRVTHECRPGNTLICSDWGMF